MAFSPEQVEREIRAWSRAHPRMRLSLTRVDRQDHIALFTLGHIKFQLYFKSNWQPLFFATENTDLNQLLSMANVLLSTHGYLQQRPPKKASEKTLTETNSETTTDVDASKPAESASPAPVATPETVDEAITADSTSKPSEEVTESAEENPSSTSAPEVATSISELIAAANKLKLDMAAESASESEIDGGEIGLGRVFDMVMEGYKTQFNFEEDELEEDDFDLGDEENEDGTEEAPADPREPTDEEWLTIVIPAIRRFARHEGMAPYLTEEWVRRANQTKSSTGVMAALTMLRDELISGGTIPRSLRPFIPRNAFGFHSGATSAQKQKDEVKQYLSLQWQDLGRRLVSSCGFYARPFKGNELHWVISFFDFEANSPLGVSLMQLALQHYSFNDKSLAAPVDLNETPSGIDTPSYTRKVEAAKITLEMLFPDSFEDEDAFPVFRLIRPTLPDLPVDFFDNVFKTFKPRPKLAASASSTAPAPLTESAEAAKAAPSYYASLHLSTGANSVASDVSDDVASTESKPVSSTSVGAESSILSSTDAPVSETPVVEESGSGNVWRDRKFNLFDFLVDVRQCLANASPKVDMNSAMTGYQTTGFWKRFRCISAVMAEEEKIEGTGKVCLPASCLELIYGGLGGASFSLSQSGNLSPMTFELFGIESKVQTYCGVLEFTAQEGTVVIPSWMISQLNFQEGELVMMRKITLPPGDFVKLQPHTDSYQVEGINPKALLEWRLRDFVALTKGEVLPIISHGHTFKFSVLEVKPGHAIAITDRDITVEFVDPIESSETPSYTPTTISSSPSSVAPNAQPEVAPKNPLRTGHTAQDETVEGGKRCDNCRHMIPEASYLTHSMRCPRMNYYCEPCQMAVPKADKESHDASMHSAIECGRCRAKLERRELPNHSENVCPARIVKCSYCELDMPASSKESHEKQCGARTMKCADCGVRISMRFLEEHKASGCVKKEEPRRYDSPTRGGTSTNGSASPSPFNPNAQIFVCETCKAPIDSFDELQVHMLTVHYADAAMGATEPTVEEPESPAKPTEE